jgi:hypothetical protein
MPRKLDRRCKISAGRAAFFCQRVEPPSSSPFWMDESYDHIVRDAKELTAFRDYTARNPAKAGLKPEEYSLQLRNVLVP